MNDVQSSILGLGNHRLAREGVSTLTPSNYYNHTILYDEEQDNHIVYLKGSCC